METYQPIYDAVRSRISGGNIGEAVADVARQSFDISMTVAILGQEFGLAAERQRQAADEAMRPAVMFKPRVFIDGNQWCALYGDNLQDGCAGFGDSIAEAMQDFDKQWSLKLPSSNFVVAAESPDMAVRPADNMARS